jgi:tRNA-splicing ligase RtcB
VARKVLSILGAREVDLVHNHHNFAWKEQHGGRELIVIRKGATPAFPGQRGFIGGSMGDDAVIVEGTRPAAGSGDASRPDVAQRIAPGLVSPEMMHEWVKRKGVILRGGGLDESPHVYRRLPDVLAAQQDTITILHTLRPLIVAMAGPDEFDPYKD